MSAIRTRQAAYGPGLSLVDFMQYERFRFHRLSRYTKMKGCRKRLRYILSPNVKSRDTTHVLCYEQL